MMSEAYYNRGIVYRNKGLPDIAIADFMKAVKLGNESAGKDIKAFFNIVYQGYCGKCR